MIQVWSRVSGLGLGWAFQAGVHPRGALQILLGHLLPLQRETEAWPHSPQESGRDETTATCYVLCGLQRGPREAGVAAVQTVYEDGTSCEALPETPDIQAEPSALLGGQAAACPAHSCPAQGSRTRPPDRQRVGEGEGEGGPTRDGTRCPGHRAGLHVGAAPHNQGGLFRGLERTSRGADRDEEGRGQSAWRPGPMMSDGSLGQGQWELAEAEAC